MKFLCLLCVVSSLPFVEAGFSRALAGGSPAMPARAAQLDDVARVGSVMVDGDVCQRIVTERALKYMFTADPRDPWVAGDNYDVDDAAFIAIKKTLLRLSRLAPAPVDVNLWMPIKGHLDKIRVVVRTVHEMSQFWPWGALYQDMIPQMKTVLVDGKRVTITDKLGWISVLAPVSDSLGDVVGVLEVVTQTHVDARANVK
jgi:hypothetical protein